MFSKFPALSVFLASLIVAIAIFCVFPPYYGLMDDANFFHFLPPMHQKGFWNFLIDWLPQDIEVRGWFRPFLPLMVYVLYIPTEGSPLALHIWNAIIALGSLFLFALGFERFWQIVFSERKWNSQIFAGVFFVLLLIYPWSHIGVVLPAVQEKVVFIAAALTLFLFSSTRIYQLPVVIKLTLYMAGIALASLVREQFILFFPLLLAILWVREEKRKIPWQTLVVLIFCICNVVFIWWMGRNTGYKSKFGMATVFDTLRQSRSIWLFLGVALASLLSPLFAKVSLKIKLAQLTPALSLLGFLALMAPWGLGGYLNVIAAPLMVACLMTLMPQRLSQPFPRPLWFVLCGGGLLFFAGIILVDAVVKNDLGRLLNSDELKTLSQSQKIQAPCEEGAGAIRSHANMFMGYNLQMAVPPNFAKFKEQNPEIKSYWIVGKHLGCWPGDFDPVALVNAGGGRVVWQGRLPWSPRLLELN
jgi:hypothetical protein